ncbi:MAG: DUF5655 domain-containing protein [Actinomycetota bacterium]
MPIFSKSKNSLKLIREKKIDLERDIQKLTEANLEEVFGLQFICGATNKEFQLQNLRVDTIAYNAEAKSFVLIEYKRDKNYSVIDQGFSYLQLLLNNQADFVLELNERAGSNLKKSDIDWSQSRVVFIAPSFTAYQLGALGFNDLPIELWEVKVYENNTILYNRLEVSGSTASINSLSGRVPAIRQVSDQVKVYSEDDLMEGVSEKAVDLYITLKAQILALGSDVALKATKNYISFSASRKFVDIHIYKNRLRLYVTIEKPNDPLKILRPVPASYNWGENLYDFNVSDETEIPAAMQLIRQSYLGAVPTLPAGLFTVPKS